MSAQQRYWDAFRDFRISVLAGKQPDPKVSAILESYGVNLGQLEVRILEMKKEAA